MNRARQIVRTIERRYPQNLKTLARAGLPKRGLLTIIALITESSLELSKQNKQKLRERQQSFETWSNTVAAWNKSGMDPVVAAFYEQRVGEVRASADLIGKLLSEQGRQLPKRIPSQSVDILLRSIRMRNPTFNKWTALGRVLGDAFKLRGWNDRTRYRRHVAQEMGTTKGGN